MTLGFIGTGTITAAIIRGLGRWGWTDPILVSPRNAELARTLAEAWSFVTVAADNQAIVDGSDMAFLAVRPQVAEAVLAGLRFKAGQDVVSLIATLPLGKLATLVGAGPTLSRAIPLPFVEQGIGVTPVHPPASAAAPIFERLGSVIAVADESQMNLLLAASSTMGAFFQQQAAIADWLAAHGLPPSQARRYLGKLMAGLSHSTDLREGMDFHTLVHEFSTQGGTNEQIHHHLAQAGVPAQLGEALDAVLARVTGD
ncbi:MAG: pyrroline-5-carboxylate reductase [Candidatus Devosia phytovorans]|uniref:Pyrroline-5-carboxylate reductase n=1 Tax=Candidatus Devosia phytovorans TaxID=3121372 RepID=A0AAJ5VT80_9HYPH|nr:pyrroline-5-carboxylate reductase [Devosia sp.]WEK04393.1 MAG: pyrroline-5-carboxylate reductase [Devosia sp.]